MVRIRLVSFIICQVLTVIETEERFEVILDTLSGHSVSVDMHLLVGHLSGRVTLVFS